MVESIGLQQVLQLSSTVERVQMAQQSQGPEMARGFDRELEKTVEHQRDQAQETKEIENAKIREEDQRQRQRHTPPQQRDTGEEEQSEEPTGGPASQTDQGNLINVVA